MRTLAAIFLACTVVVAPLAVSAGGLDPEAARAVFEDRCSKCHALDRALRKNKDRAGWEKTVLRMKRYGSGMISDEDVAAVVEHLVRVRGPNP